MNRKKSNRKDWTNTLNSAQSLLATPEIQSSKQSFNDLKLMYLGIISKHSELTYPNASRQFEQKATDLMSNSLCMKSHKVMAKLGSLMAAQSKDSYSHGFYSRMASEISHPLYKERLKLKETLGEIK